jgi:predicted nucleic acid-binding protein
MIFVDTSAWIALTDTSDQYHPDAKAIYERLKRQRAWLVTTEYILDEAVTRLRYDSGHALAVHFLDLVETTARTGVLRIVSISPVIFQAAVALFRQYDTAVLALTDCTSFVVCEQYRITEAFAFDQHFLMRGIILCVP